jgi:hypothetical protein
LPKITTLESIVVRSAALDAVTASDFDSQFLEVPIGHPSGSDVLLCQSGPPASSPNIVADYF